MVCASWLCGKARACAVLHTSPIRTTSIVRESLLRRASVVVRQPKRCPQVGVVSPAGLANGVRGAPGNAERCLRALPVCAAGWGLAGVVAWALGRPAATSSKIRTPARCPLEAGRGMSRHRAPSVNCKHTHLARRRTAGERILSVFARQRGFVSNASHELRTSLTVIRGQIEVLAPAQRCRAQDRVRPNQARCGELAAGSLCSSSSTSRRLRPPS
jgi:signal transduction histidine kinase